MEDLPARLEKFIREQQLCSADDRLLLTVSGGIDSMVMAHILVERGYRCGIAHCNFSLRGEESDEDEAFIRRWAEERRLPLYIRRFETATYAAEKGISVQMAARELRYRWFEEVRRREGYDRIALAHNRDDVAETLLINLTRGTGLRGLASIPVRQEALIRPLLFASRREIEAWALRQGIAWREDSSNRTVKYMRNKIRHQIIPLFEEMNPSFTTTLAATAARLRGVVQLFDRYVGEMRPRLLLDRGDHHLIPLAPLRQTAAWEAVLLELLKPFGFRPGTVNTLLHHLDAPPGKQFLSPTHRLVKDRDTLIITPLPEKEKERRYYVEEGTEMITEPLHLHFRILERDDSFRIPGDPNIAAVDAELIAWPLVIRRWKAGDYFRPLGMKGMKKLSDFFIDQKLSLVDKENLWLVTEGERIVWIPGMRIDDRYKITPSTEKVLLIEWLR